MPRLRQSARLALDSLRINPLRTGLSTLGIVMGAASLSAVLALGDGAERFARQRIEREGMNLVVLQPRTEQVIDGLRVPAEKFPLFTEEDARSLAGALGVATSVVLRAEGTGLVTVPGQRQRGARVEARMAARPDLGASAVARGRALGPADGDDVVVVSHALAEELRTAGAAGSEPGQTLALGGKARTVVGVLPPYPGERGFAVQVPFAAGDSAMVAVPSARPRTIVVRTPRVEDVPALKTDVERWLARRPDWRDQVTVAATGPRRLQDVAQGILVFKMLMGAFTAISLLVGGIGITNVLLASILERTREIGIRKAVGARRRDLVLQFLVESVTIAGAGALVGVALGVSGALSVTAVIRARTEVWLYAAVTWQTLAVSAAAAVLVGLAAGMYPALRASRLTPMDAIQRD